MTEGLHARSSPSPSSALRLHRVEAACLPHNTASRKLLAKSGFREEGYAREYIAIDGAFQDHVLFGLIQEEWAAAKAASR
jgi:ribosomal-protein-alanine N-acetyltransferase